MCKKYELQLCLRCISKSHWDGDSTVATVTTTAILWQYGHENNNDNVRWYVMCDGQLTLSLLSSKSVFSQTFKKQLYE